MNIKVRIQSEGQPAETLWATSLGEGKARIENIPCLYQDIGYMSIVEIDKNNQVTNVVSSPYRTMAARYHVSKNEDLVVASTENIATFNFISGYLYANDIHCEGIVSGLMSIAVPKTISDEELGKICDGLPKKDSIQIINEVTVNDMTEEKRND